MKKKMKSVRKCITSQQPVRERPVRMCVCAYAAGEREKDNIPATGMKRSAVQNKNKKPFPSNYRCPWAQCPASSLLHSTKTPAQYGLRSVVRGTGLAYYILRVMFYAQPASILVGKKERKKEWVREPVCVCAYLRARVFMLLLFAHARCLPSVGGGVLFRVGPAASTLAAAPWCVLGFVCISNHFREGQNGALWVFCVFFFFLFSFLRRLVLLVQEVVARGTSKCCIPHVADGVRTGVNKMHLNVGYKNVLTMKFLSKRRS